MNSFCMLLGVYLSSSLATFVDSSFRYTLNKLDTESNGIYVVRNTQAGYGVIVTYDSPVNYD